MGPPGMARPPGRFVLPGPGRDMGPDARPMGAPTGIAAGTEPWGAFRHAWIRFLPSGWVTRGWSLEVVKVYTRPVSDTTRSRTWVPVRVDNSYA